MYLKNSILSVVGTGPFEGSRGPWTVKEDLQFRFNAAARRYEIEIHFDELEGEFEYKIVLVERNGRDLSFKFEGRPDKLILQSKKRN